MMLIIFLKAMLKLKFFKSSTKDDSLQPDISDDDFRSSNPGVFEVGYSVYVFDIRYQQIFAASQPINVEIKFDGVVLMM